MSGEILSGVRKAFASKGDDVTLTRFVKLPGRHASGYKVGPMPRDAIGTRFPRRVLPPTTGLLVSGHNSIKLGRDVRKAKHRGYWIYSLSLEERATCPTSCTHWLNCYGNGMPLAKRIDHTDPNFLPALEKQIAKLCGMKNRAGLLIRLHALGDFFSVAYVKFWERMLRRHDNLAVFGYTARPPEIGIGWEIRYMNRLFGDRCMIRFSDGGLPAMSTVSIGDETGCPPDAFICPEQTGKTRCCATCGACWSTRKNVAFMEH
jgi:hypothetical protein